MDEEVGSRGKLTDKIKSLSRNQPRWFSSLLLWFIDPDLIILDEPFSGLDPVNTGSKQVIFGKKSAEQPLFFSDHVMTNVEELAVIFWWFEVAKMRSYGPVQDAHQSKRVSLFQVNEAGRSGKLHSCQARWAWPNKAVRVILVERWKGALFNFDSGAIHRNPASKRQQLMRIFKLESGVEVEICGL